MSVVNATLNQQNVSEMTNYSNRDSLKNAESQTFTRLAMFATTLPQPSPRHPKKFSCTPIL